jgi:signal transduction histidine kinase
MDPRSDTPEPIAASTYLAALSAATDGVLVFDGSGVVVYANPAAEAFFGDDALPGQSFTDISTVDRRTVAGIWRDLRRVRRWTGRLRIRASLPEVDVTLQRLCASCQGEGEGGGEGEPAREHFCVVLHGAGRAARDEAGERAAQPATCSKASRFASEIAHDFNNQIAVILNYTFVLLRQMPSDSPLKAHVAEMQAAAWRASQVAQAIHRALVTRTLVPSRE